MIVALSDVEMDQVRHMAAARHDPKRARDVVDRKIDGNRSSFEIEVAGTMGEAAVAKALRVPMHLLIGVAGDGREGDLVYRGRSVQVKHRFWRRGYLIFSTLDKFKADVAVMTCPGNRENEVEIVGYVDRSWFLQEMERKDFGYGLHYALASERLRPFEQFLEYASL